MPKKYRADCGGCHLAVVTGWEKQKALEWLRDFRLRDIWKLQSDEDDIAIIIDRIVVNEDGTAGVHLIDSSVQKYTFPEYHPEKYKAEKKEKIIQEASTKEKISQEAATEDSNYRNGMRKLRSIYSTVRRTKTAEILLQ